jgi:tRNA threonylcarbamoyl adenosine modification protein YeaZ
MSGDMRVLGLETSSQRASVVLLDGQRVLGAAESAVAGAHAERLLPMVADVLRMAGLEVTDVERFGVGIGPGSFTGVRVGLSVARGMARGLGVPVAGVGSLQAMAAACSEPATIVALLDARRSEVFAAAYGADGVERIAPQAVSIATFDAWLASHALGAHVFVGSGCELVGHPVKSADDACALPHARWVAHVAAQLDPAQHTANPVYVRDAGATAQKLPASPF